jgi:hypothetical protein
MRRTDGSHAKLFGAQLAGIRRSWTESASRLKIGRDICSRRSRS